MSLNMPSNPGICMPQSLPPVRTDSLTARSLLEYFQNTWELYELLFSSIHKEGALYENPDPLRHPLIFYLGHTAAFYINKLVISGILPESKRINPHFELLFEQGVDPASSEELGKEVWPSVEAVKEFRLNVYDLIVDFVASCAFGEIVDSNHRLWSILMGLEHDRIHFETSSVLIRQYPVDWVSRPQSWEYAPKEFISSTNDWLQVPATSVNLGKPADFPTFGWDNEYGSLRENVSSFEAGRNLITNSEFMDFVQDGGYERNDLWSKDAWAWRSRLNIKHPKFWVKTEDRFAYRAMFDEMEMPGSWPVEVNQYEANAFCAWKKEGARLLTENEFHAIAQTGLDSSFDLPFSDHFNLNLQFGSPTPVGMLPTAASKLGFNDVWGNVWCWLSNDFYPLPGFEKHPYYTDFSQPYMDADHPMLLGGSWASSGTSASKFYRLWFRPYFYQHAGFRLARSR